MNAINLGLGTAGRVEDKIKDPRLFDAVLDRHETEIPGNYLPDAAGVLIAGETILRAAGYWPGAYRSRVWNKKDRHVFRRDASSDPERTLQVRACGKFWTVEYFMKYDPHPICGLKIHALCCAFSGQPIWTRSYQSAMRLAEHCDPLPRPPVAGLWKRVRL